MARRLHLAADMTRRRRDFLIVGGVLAIGIAIVPWLGGEYHTQLWTQAFTFAIAAISLDLVWGYTGIPDLGHSVWFGIGALTVGLMTTTVSDTGLVLEAGGTAPTYILAVIAGTVAAGICGGIVAWYAFPSRGANLFYIGVVGLALSTAIQPLYTQLPSVTGGENGLFGFAYGGLSTVGWYYLVAVCFVLVMLGALVLVRSDFGLLIAAIRDNERRARYLGNDVERIKIVVFALGAAGAGFAGALYGALVGLVSAPLFGFQFATEMLVWVAVGGRATIIGPAAGAIALSLIGSELNRSFPAQWNLALGALFVAVVVFVPDGIVAPWAKWLRRRIMGGARDLTAEPAAPRADGAGGMLVDIRDVRFSYGALNVLRGIDLAIERGRLLCIVGPNGAGKSTLIEVLTDGRRPIDGTITFDLGTDRDHRRRRPQAIARHGLIRKFQIPALFRSLTVAEHLLLAGRRGRWPSFWRRTHAIGVPPAVLEVLTATGLDASVAVTSNALAHGLKQGLEIAMSVAARPVLLLLDEPTAGLTATERAVVGTILRRLVADGITIVLIEHDFDFVGEVADRVAVLHDGRVVETGTFAEVSASAVVRDAYLGAAR
jgi:branched-chain amino acid transport system permease protein